MRKLMWYRQQRVDGAVRTALDVDGATCFHLFENESDEPDPVLLWFVDVRCEGVRLPVAANEARQWLLDQGDVIRANLLKLAEDLRAGIDVDVWPLQRKVSGLPARVKAAIVCAVTRRLEGTEFAKVLIDIADHWEERLRSLPAVGAARAG